PLDIRRRTQPRSAERAWIEWIVADRQRLAHLEPRAELRPPKPERRRPIHPRCNTEHLPLVGLCRLLESARHRCRAHDERPLLLVARLRTPPQPRRGRELHAQPAPAHEVRIAVVAPELLRRQRVDRARPFGHVAHIAEITDPECSNSESRSRLPGKFRAPLPLPIV